MIVEYILRFLDSPRAGSLLGIAGILVGYFLFLASSKRKILAYDIRTTILLKEFKNKIDGINISYHGEAVENLALTKIAIWNAGRDAIRASDISSLEQIRVNLNGRFVGEEYELIHYSHPDQIKIIPESEGVFLVSFDYLDSNEGVVIQFFHTWAGDVSITGKIIGSTSPRRQSQSSGVLSLIRIASLSSPVFLLFLLHESFLRYFEISKISIYYFNIYSPRTIAEYSLFVLLPSYLMLKFTKTQGFRWFLNDFLRKKVFGIVNDWPSILRYLERLD